MSMLQRPHAAFERCVRCKLCTMSRKVTLVCGLLWDYSVLRAAELTGLSSFQKPRNLLVCYWSKFCKWNICSRSTFFHQWEVVQIFQNEISSGGSLFIEKLVRGEPILGGPFLPWHTLRQSGTNGYEHTYIPIYRPLFCLSTTLQDA